jgi:hypothetical protein
MVRGAAILRVERAGAVLLCTAWLAVSWRAICMAAVWWVDVELKLRELREDCGERGGAAGL